MSKAGDLSGMVPDVDSGLEAAAVVAARDVLGVGPGEKALIITNPEANVHAVSAAVYDAVRSLGGRPVLMVQPLKTQLDFAEPAVIDAISSAPDICISLSAEKLGKDEAGIRKNYELAGRRFDHVFDYLMKAGRMRSFWSPGVTVDMFGRTVPIDYARLRRECADLRSVLDRAVGVHVVSEKGTDITIGVRGRLAQVDDGDFRRPGTGGNLPAGEVYVSPELGSSSGTIVFDGSISLEKGDMVMKTPITARVENNMITGLEGGREAEMLEATLRAGRDNALEMVKDGKLDPATGEEYARNARNLGELGIGLNRKARIVGNMLEDEKVFSTCHIAIGANYDDDARALIHLDGLIKDPTIAALNRDGSRTLIMESGQLML